MGICATYHFRSIGGPSQPGSPLPAFFSTSRVTPFGSGVPIEGSSGGRRFSSYTGAAVAAEGPNLGRRSSAFTGVAVAPSNVSLVQQSWLLVKNDLDPLGREVFVKLFARLPETQKLFGFQGDPNFLTSRSLRVHAVAVLRTIGKLVAGMTNLEAFTPVLLQLSRTHMALGVPIASFGAMRGALLEVLSERLGPHWTPEVDQAWESAFDAIVAAIKSDYPKEDAAQSP